VPGRFLKSRSGRFLRSDEAQDPSFQKPLEIASAIGHQEQEDLVPCDPIDEAMRLDDHLAELPDPQLQQLLRVGAQLREPAEAGGGVEEAFQDPDIPT